MLKQFFVIFVIVSMFGYSMQQGIAGGAKGGANAGFEFSGVGGQAGGGGGAGDAGAGAGGQASFGFGGNAGAFG